MRYQRRVASTVSQFRTRPPFLFQCSQPSRSSSQLQPNHNRHHRLSFGIAFDIDGVILRGRSPIGGSPHALRRLYNNSGSLKVPFLFLTNGMTDISLMEPLGVARYENELILATGKGEPAVVMSEYGFKNVLSLDDYASLFKNIDPVAQYKRWTTKPELVGNDLSVNGVPRRDVPLETVKAVFVVSDPVDWGRDIQVLCDVLRSGGLPGQNSGHQPPLYFAADDLQYQAAFPSERLGMGAFRIALESIFNRVHHNALEYVTYGKPNPFVFRNAEAVLSQLHPFYNSDNVKECVDSGSQDFETLYMIGDNPSVDTKGAQLAGHPWFSILTRTGVFRGERNHAEFPADLVVDTVEEAVDYILEKEGVS